jgi:hypothetical protein
MRYEVAFGNFGKVKIFNNYNRAVSYCNKNGGEIKILESKKEIADQKLARKRALLQKLNLTDSQYKSYAQAYLIEQHVERTAHNLKAINFEEFVTSKTAEQAA